MKVPPLDRGSCNSVSCCPDMDSSGVAGRGVDVGVAGSPCSWVWSAPASPEGGAAGLDVRAALLPERRRRPDPGRCRTSEPAGLPHSSPAPCGPAKLIARPPRVACGPTQGAAVDAALPPTDAALLSE